MISIEEIENYKENNYLLYENKKKCNELSEKIKNFELKVQSFFKPLCNKLLPFNDSKYLMTFESHAVIIKFYNSFNNNMTISIFYDNLSKIKTKEDLLKYAFKGNKKKV